MFANLSYPVLFSVFATLCLWKHLNTEEKNYHLSSAPQVATMVSISNSNKFAAEININNLEWRINVMIKRFAAALVGGACLVSASAAFAATTSAVIDVSANIAASCSIGGLSSLNFGTLEKGGASNASTMMAVSCNGQRPVSVKLVSENEITSMFTMRRTGETTNISWFEYKVYANGTNVSSSQQFEITMQEGPGSFEGYVELEATVAADTANYNPEGSYSDRMTVEVSY